MIGTIFNGEAGFKFEEIEADSRHYRVDVLQYPYMKYCELLGCKELTGTFCLSDDRVYGDMCGITFERHGTIGRGSDKCDFFTGISGDRPLKSFCRNPYVTRSRRVFCLIVHCTNIF